MGKLIWHEHARLVSITATIYGIWAAYWGLFYRKFFWDFIGSTLRNPGGAQPGPNVAPFITVIVKVPVVQIFAMLLGFFILALEWPLPLMKKLPIYRNIVVRMVLLFFQTFLNILFYQATIVSKIPGQYRKAKESGDLLFFPSTVVHHRDADTDLEFQIRVCPALKSKPQRAAVPDPTVTASISPNVLPRTKPIDPFMPPYNENLYVGELRDEDSEDEYVVLMNKFSVVPNHFLLISKEYQSQSSALLPQDLVQTYKLLVEARKTGIKFFAFYNCGDFSGASQPHKHIQFFPIDPTEAGPPIERLARTTNIQTPSKPFTISKLPYANHVFRLPHDLQYEDGEKLGRTLTEAFLALLDLGISTVRHAPDYPIGRPSYNVIFTLEHMHLIPRRCEAYSLPEKGDVIPVNSLGFAGLLLLLADENLENVKAHGVGKVLKGVGLESVHELQLAGTTDETVDMTRM
ncbi:hypothetical protein AGABI2DRAFT_220942 [Agaricus bisporus var. bisporus H97]|uniref:hypothetical protein n=1 Tax=Agaricus bisporus var. bisporus (strain H97 / ATCC MYA-4626 / FGSC 10389) TaxID=936046 RepID=UPI00029F555B|nr:hypothetical protein AGABI2DRAFT_220942 [Agaricus bisporus var. bisporus H97]EKV47120.1 hypothetical protein AGABI2DRAFT_220942 [Agaricus bisporus var. bisporus H97]